MALRLCRVQSLKRQSILQSRKPALKMVRETSCLLAARWPRCGRSIASFDPSRDSVRDKRCLRGAARPYKSITIRARWLDSMVFAQSSTAAPANVGGNPLLLPSDFGAEHWAEQFPDFALE